MVGYTTFRLGTQNLDRSFQDCYRSDVSLYVKNSGSRALKMSV